MNKLQYLIVPIIGIGLTVPYTVLAWNGDHVPLVCLAILALLVSIASGIFAWGWRDAIKGWGRSTSGWAAAQSWGMQQDTILRDVLKELREYDEEAFVIHQGRSLTASLEYIHTFGKEDE